MFCIRRPDAIKHFVSLNAVKAFAAFVPFLTVAGTASAQTIYTTDFNSLTTGVTAPSPGNAGQGGWYVADKNGTAFGEIESAIANPGKALHLSSPNNQFNLQRRNFDTAWDITSATNVTMSFDFFASTTNLASTNAYSANSSFGGQGSETYNVGIGAGNGSARTTLSIVLYQYNGVNNNDFIGFFPAGQNLAFNRWHTVVYTINPSADRYTSITVDGVTQSLTGFRLPYRFNGSQFVRDNIITSLNARMSSVTVGNVNNTTDDVYYDNFSITAIGAVAAPEPGTLAFLLPGLMMGAGIVRRSRRK